MEMNQLIDKAREISGLLGERSAAGSLALGEVFSEALPAASSVSFLFEKALESPLASGEDSRMKKLMAAALHVAAARGIDIGINAVPEAIASFADEAYTRLKTSVQVASGQIDVYQAADVLIDHAAARLTVVAEQAVAKGVPLAVNALCTALTRFYPPIEVLTPYIRNAAQYLTPRLQEAVRGGIQRLSAYAKTAVRQAVPAALKLVSRIKQKLLG